MATRTKTRGFIEIDAGIALGIVVATLLVMAVLLLDATSTLKEKTSTFQEMEKSLEGKGENCVATVKFKGGELRRICNDPIS